MSGSKRAHMIQVIINCIYRTGYQFTFSTDTNGTKFQLEERKINEANCTKKKKLIWEAKSQSDGRAILRLLRNPQVHYCLYKVCIKKPTRCHFCVVYFSSTSCSTCFGQPCAHHQELTTAWCYSLVLVCTLVSAVMNLRVPWNAGNFLTSCKPVSCSGRTLHHGVS